MLPNAETHLDLLLVSYIRERPGVNLNFFRVVGAVQVPVGFRQLAFMIPGGEWRQIDKFVSLSVQFPAKKNEEEESVSTPVPSVTMTLVHEQNVVYFILYVEGVQRYGLVQGEGVVSHVGVSKGLFCRQPIHGVKGQDLLQEIQSCAAHRK